MRIFNKNQRGNVLFLILIAVALFAALSYAVTQSSRSGGDSGRETTILNSAQLSQYPNSIRTAVLRQVIDGTTVTAVRFNKPASFGTLGSNRLGVFQPEGGGAVYQDAPSDFMADGNPGEWFYNMEFHVTNIGITDATSLNGNELIAFLPGVTIDVCQRINLEAGITTTGTASPPVTADLSGGSAGDYDINMVTSGSDYVLPTTSTELDSTANDLLDGQPFGCFQNTASGDYVYFHVLSER